MTPEGTYTHKDQIPLGNDSMTCATCQMRYFPWRHGHKEGHKEGNSCVKHGVRVKAGDKACVDYQFDGAAPQTWG